MRPGRILANAITLLLLTFVLTGCSDRTPAAKPKTTRLIVASDSILSTMTESLVPSPPYSVTAILPPGQCPGHYDIKLSDIEQIERADLIVSFKGAPYMDKAANRDRHLVIDAAGRNFMVPDSYVRGLGILANRLSQYSPGDSEAIMELKAKAIRSVEAHAASLVCRIQDAGLSGKPVIAASMQKQALEWMGFRVAGEYGRPETLSAREVMRLVNTGKQAGAILVVDNLQSGPDAGKGIAESLGIPHIVLSNFPSEKGYLATLTENVDIILAASQVKRNASVRQALP